MKNMILLCLASALFFSCKKQDIQLYDIEKDGIQFEYPANQFHQSFDFSFQSIEEMDDWGWPTNVYLGDSLRTQKISLIVSLLGWESKEDRTFKLKALNGEGLSPELVALEPEYTFAAGQLKDTIEVTLLRPARRGVFNIQLAFDTEDANADFELGAEEKGKYSITVTDHYPKPQDWDGRSAWLGEYDEEKYAFIVSVLQITYGYYVDWGNYNKRLRDALDKYNSENLNNPKNFTFPVNTDSIWWY